MPTIGNLGTLYVRNKDGVLEEVPVICGKDGLTPYIGENGNWWIGDEDTGVKATGEITARPQVTSGKGEPTTSKVGEKDDLYVDTDTGYIYHLESVTPVHGGYSYTWVQVGGVPGESGTAFETGDGLKLEDGVLSLDLHEITNEELQKIIDQANGG